MGSDARVWVIEYQLSDGWHIEDVFKRLDEAERCLYQTQSMRTRARLVPYRRVEEWG